MTGSQLSHRDINLLNTKHDNHSRMVSMSCHSKTGGTVMVVRAPAIVHITATRQHTCPTDLIIDVVLIRKKLN